ncbi:hypothetical protein DM860_015106 [Cuscuta australis]|uniref:PHD-type domain-containing protein n=1 Tax=Cuscuta australis TaxID=267555 RepID=A0A328DTR8_9ASTE|nr:hypothetical protein DM860_015106 [Cuscuta australis]
MPFSGSSSVPRKTKDNKLGDFRVKKKLKRIESICEKAYNRNHSVAGRVDPIDPSNAEENELELRRSTRVRKAPVLLDSSPPPPKKRAKLGKRGGMSGENREEDGKQFEIVCSISRDLVHNADGWKSRLRSRRRNESFVLRRKGVTSPAFSRKLSENSGKFKGKSIEDDELFHDKQVGKVCGKLTIFKSKRPGRIKASSAFEKQGIDLSGSLEGDELNNAEEGQMSEDDDTLILKNDALEEEEKIINSEEALEEVNEENFPFDSERNKAVKGASVPSPTVNIEDEVEMCSHAKQCTGSDHIKLMDQGMPVEWCVGIESGDKGNDLEIGLATHDEKENGNASDVINKHSRVGYDEKTKDAVDGVIFYKRKDKRSCDRPPGNHRMIDASRKLKIKVGRRCGLCGGATDGKPPRKLVQYVAQSDNEAHSETSASEEPNYDEWDGFGDEPTWLGRLLGPVNDRFGIAGVWIHQQCAVWSPEVYFAGLGCMKNVRAALSRGRVLKCSRCARTGATIGCRVDRCPKTYHLSCARATGCIFDHRKFLIACTDHKHLFQPHGSKYLHYLRKMKTKKMMLELRKTSNDACRKDIEAEEKWMENYGEDEEFLKRERKRLHRDLSKITPVYIGGANSDSGVEFQGWESVAGLQDVIQCMKEVVTIPLLYPEFFSSLGLTPPRGVLLHGYPGTGKTLVVRALIGSCARGDKRIAYFARKGADCLGKYVGDAERQLRLLFQVAEKSQPSIIFFDEIDGLAPCRTKQQDQTHSSVVSTLLALMDGLKSRGSVVVIGATNRPDAIDPALRRPGRFDREIYFPLPSVKDREAILSLHTKKWPKPVSGPLLKLIARKTVGFAGADLQALCTQAAIISLKRSFPLHQYLSAAAERGPHVKHATLPSFTVEEQDWLDSLVHASPPCSQREARMAANEVVSSPLHTCLFPCLSQPLCKLIVSLYLDERVCLPHRLFKAASLVKDIFISALDKKKILTSNWWFYINDLLKEPDIYHKVEDELSRAGILIRDFRSSTSCLLEEIFDDDDSAFGYSKLHHIGARAHLMETISGKKSGFRILVSGNPRCGQRHIASCLVHCFVGNTDIQKIDMAAMSQEGHGDILQGLTGILMRYACAGRCIIFMPRLDLWAVEASSMVFETRGVALSGKHQLYEERSLEEIKNEKSYPVATTMGLESKKEVREASDIWNSFVEQAETLCVSKPLSILATTDMPFKALPLTIRQYFKGQQLDQSLSTPLGGSVPQFSIELDDSFNVDLIVNLFASRLSIDLVEHFVQLLYRANHMRTIPQNGNANADNKENVMLACVNSKPETTTEHESKNVSINHITTAVSPNTKTGKGMSSMLLAITTFGYQILQYPHFAELCWATSKLKDGPCADINGAWKGWPFNSCIIRPSNSVNEVALSTSTVKSKASSGIVRGLIAIGLSAYTGKYTSLRVVSSDVRKVLELLVARINEKVQDGKDRYHFSRLLSQVAYLDDMVSSWLYMLQSFEMDTECSGPKANSTLNCVGNSEEPNPLRNTTLEGDDNTFHDARTVVGGNYMARTDVGFQPMDTDHSIPVKNVASALNLNMKIVKHNLVNVEANYRDQDEEGASQLKNCSPSEISNPTDAVSQKGGDCGPAIHSNGHVDIQDQEDDDGCDTENDLRREDEERETCDHANVKATNIPTVSGLVCHLGCCNECLGKLQRLLRDAVKCELGLEEKECKVDDVNDFVASVSAKFHSSLRLWLRPENSGCAVMKITECSCHGTDSAVNAHLDLCQNSQYIFRDGLLTNFGTCKDASFHCQFKKLCLHSLIEWVKVGKEP